MCSNCRGGVPSGAATVIVFFGEEEHLYPDKFNVTDKGSKDVF